MVNYCWYLCQNSCGRFRLCWQSTWTDMQLPFFLCRRPAGMFGKQPRHCWEKQLLHWRKNLKTEVWMSLEGHTSRSTWTVWILQSMRLLCIMFDDIAFMCICCIHMGGCIGTVSFFDVLSTPHALVGRFINWSRDYPGEFFEMLRCKIILVLATLATQARVVGLVFDSSCTAQSPIWQTASRIIQELPDASRIIVRLRETLWKQNAVKGRVGNIAKLEYCASAWSACHAGNFTKAWQSPTCDGVHCWDVLSAYCAAQLHCSLAHFFVTKSLKSSASLTCTAFFFRST